MKTTKKFINNKQLTQERMVQKRSHSKATKRNQKGAEANEIAKNGHPEKNESNGVGKGRKKGSTRIETSEGEKEGTVPVEDTTKVMQPTKRTKRKREAVKFEDDDELPHGLGNVVKRENKKEETDGNASELEDVDNVDVTKEESKTPQSETRSKSTAKPPTKKASSKAAANQNDAADDEPPTKKAKQTLKKPTKSAEASPSTSTKKFKAKAPKSYGLTPGTTPFPNYPRPTAADCYEVYAALASLHGESAPPKTIPVPSEVVAGCGEVPAVLDAMIRTYLSSNTTGRNSSAAFQGLVKTFGTLKTGIGKGSVDWNAVRLAPQEEVFEAIKHGGLGQVKSKTIKAILDAVYEENLQRRHAMDEPTAADPTGAIEDPSSIDPAAEKQLERMRMDQNVLSLDHYHTLSTPEAQTALTKFPGIGVKTSSCVLLFCMQRPSFAVDTHVFRLASWLGWIPEPNAPRGKGEKKVDRDTAFSHLEVRIPDDLKYGLHQLFIKHGKTCPRCRAITGEGSEGWEGANCPIERMVKRTGVRKGDVTPFEMTPKKKVVGGKGKGRKVKEEDEGSKGEATPTSNKERRAAASTRKAKSEAEELAMDGILPSKIDDSITTPRSTRSTRATKRTPVKKEKDEVDSELSSLEDDGDISADNASDDAFDGGSTGEEDDEDEEQEDEE